MRKTITKIISFLMVIVLAALSCPIQTHGYNTYFYNSLSGYDDISLARNSEQIYLIGTSGQSVIIEGVYPYEYSISLTLQQDVHMYALSSDVLILVSFLNDNNNTKITLYDISNDKFNSFIVNSDSIYMTSHFAYANKYVYIATSGGTISCYSKAGKYCGEFSLSADICSLMTDFDNNVYALTDSGMYSINNDSYTKISNLSFSTRGCFISNDIFTDEIGNFYRLYKDNKLLNYSCHPIYPCGGVYSKNLITFSQNKIFSINSKTGEKVSSYSLNDDILQLYSIDNEIVALIYSEGAPNICFVGYDELKKISNKNTQINNQTDISDDVKSRISSDVYNIDFDTMAITHIPSTTTVAQFKKNMNYDGYDVEFYRYEKDTPLKSGNVGTATQAIFYNNRERYVFELSVIGDLTGEGNVNTRDKRQIFGHVIGKIQMTGVFVTSADLDDSNEVDIIDIVLLLRLLKAQQQ